MKKHLLLYFLAVFCCIGAARAATGNTPSDMPGEGTEVFDETKQADGCYYASLLFNEMEDANL